MLYICVCVEIKRRGRGGKQIPAAKVYRGEDEEKRKRAPINHVARCLPLSSSPEELGVKGTRDSGDGGCGVEETETV